MVLEGPVREAIQERVISIVEPELARIKTKVADLETETDANTASIQRIGTTFQVVFGKIDDLSSKTIKNIADIKDIFTDLKAAWGNIGPRECFDNAYFSSKVTALGPEQTITIGHVGTAGGLSLGSRSLQVAVPGPVVAAPVAGQPVTVKIAPYKISAYKLAAPGEDSLWCRMGFLAKRVDDLGLKVGAIRQGMLPDDVVASIQADWGNVLGLLNRINGYGYTPSSFVDWSIGAIELKGVWRDKLIELIKTQAPTAEAYTRTKLFADLNLISVGDLGDTGSLNLFGNALESIMGGVFDSKFDTRFDPKFDLKFDTRLNAITKDQLLPTAKFGMFGTLLFDWIGPRLTLDEIRTNLGIGIAKTTTCNEDTIWGALRCRFNEIQQIRGFFFELVDGFRIDGLWDRLDNFANRSFGDLSFMDNTLNNTTYRVYWYFAKKFELVLVGIAFEPYIYELVPGLVAAGPDIIPYYWDYKDGGYEIESHNIDVKGTRKLLTEALPALIKSIDSYLDANKLLIVGFQADKQRDWSRYATQEIRNFVEVTVKSNVSDKITGIKNAINLDIGTRTGTSGIVPEMITLDKKIADISYKIEGLGWVRP